MLIKLYRQNVSLSSNQTHTHIYIYIYIYIYIHTQAHQILSHWNCDTLINLNSWNFINTCILVALF